MSNQPFFNSTQIRQIIIYFCGAIALIVFLGWLARHYTGIKLDWSFLIPLGGVVGALIPIATGIVGWIDKRLRENDARIDALETLATRQAEADRDRYELRKIILKLEARIESIRDERVGSQMEEVSQMLRELLNRES